MHSFDKISIPQVLDINAHFLDANAIFKNRIFKKTKALLFITSMVVRRKTPRITKIFQKFLLMHVLGKENTKYHEFTTLKGNKEISLIRRTGVVQMIASGK